MAKDLNVSGTSDGSFILNKYVDEIGDKKILTNEEEVELTRRIRNGDKVAMEIMIKSNLRFVVSIAKQYQGKGMSICDLINEGNLGLIKAVKKFDENRGNKFISYAVWWIRQSILQALAEKSRPVRLPLNIVGLLNKFAASKNKLEQEYRRTPENDEIASDINRKLSDVKNIITYSRRVTFMDTPLVNNEENSVLDLIKDTTMDPITSDLDKVLLSNTIKLAISKLQDKERKIITKFFGLDGNAENLDKIAEEMELTRERVRQIKEKALKKIKKMDECKVLLASL